MARRAIRYEHEGRWYLAQDEPGARHPAGAPPERPNRPEPGPEDQDPVLELIDRIDTALAAGTTTTAEAIVVEFPHPMPVTVQEAA